jgi:hypothetical protein
MACIYIPKPAGAHDLYVMFKGVIAANVRQLLLHSCGQVVPRACSGLHGLAASSLQLGTGANGI